MTIEDVFGTGRDLSAYQTAARAFVCFFALLALTRLAGMRAFGRKSTFDVVIVITLGAVVSRVIVGVSPALPTLSAAIVLVALHRLIAMWTAAAPAVERIVKGESCVVYRGGIFDLGRMHRAGISREDIEQAVRKHAHELSMKDVLEVRLEPTGELSVIEDDVGRRRRAALTPATQSP